MYKTIGRTYPAGRLSQDEAANRVKASTRFRPVNIIQTNLVRRDVIQKEGPLNSLHRVHANVEDP